MNKYPWLVRIWTIKPAEEESHCGGTLVATKYVVTACHCLYEYSKQAVIINGNDVYLITREYTPAELKVTIGDYKLDTINETGNERHIKVKTIRKDIEDKTSCMFDYCIDLNTTPLLNTTSPL